MFPGFAPHFYHRPDFLAGILGVVVVEYILEHRKIIFLFGAVHIVVDGDIADIIGGEDEILQPLHAGILEPSAELSGSELSLSAVPDKNTNRLPGFLLGVGPACFAVLEKWWRMGHPTEYRQPHHHEQIEPAPSFDWENAGQTVLPQYAFRNHLNPINLISHAATTPFLLILDKYL